VRRTIVLLLATLLAFASCGGDDDDSDDAAERTDDTEDSDDTTTTSAGGEESDDDPSALAQAFLDGLGFEIPTEEAECVADGLVDTLGLEGLAALGESDNPPSGQDLDDIASTLDDCVSPDTVETLLSEQFATSAPADQRDAVECLASEVAAEISMGDLVRIGFLTRSDPNSPDLAQFEDEVTAAGERCDVGQ
jgi:hypothetical protein